MAYFKKRGNSWQAQCRDMTQTRLGSIKPKVALPPSNTGENVSPLM